MVSNGSEHRSVLVAEVAVGNAKSIDKSVFPENVLGNRPRSFGQGCSIASPRAILNAGFDELLPNPLSGKLFIHPQHEQVKVLARQKSFPSPELVVERVQQSKNRQELRVDPVHVQGRRRGEIIR